MFDDLKGRRPGLVDFRNIKNCFRYTSAFYEGRLCILFEVRAKTLSRQPGEVCVPGGSVEDGEDFVTAAVRETMEELMISREQVEVIAPMDIYISVSGQIIAPYLMYLKNYKGTYNAAEVDEVFLFHWSFSWSMSRNAIKIEFLLSRRRISRQKGYPEAGNIHGAAALVLFFSIQCFRNNQ